jgi:hypothetical protein
MSEQVSDMRISITELQYMSVHFCTETKGGNLSAVSFLVHVTISNYVNSLLSSTKALFHI